MFAVPSIRQVLSNEQKKQKILKLLSQTFLQKQSKEKKLSKQKNIYFTKKGLTKFLYNFALQTGFQIPTDKQIRYIYYLLNSAEPIEPNLDETEQSQIYEQSPDIKETLGIKQQKFLLLIEISLKLYLQSKQSNIGGILQRLIMELKKQLYYMNSK